MNGIQRVIIFSLAGFVLSSFSVIAETTSQNAQSMLSKLGYKIAVDGNWGPQSDSIISQFYMERGQAYDGNLDGNEIKDLKLAAKSKIQGKFTIGGILLERSLNDTPWGYTRSTEFVRAGKKSQKFEVRPGDCGVGSTWSDCANDRERSEARGEKGWAPGANKWLAASIYIPEDFPSFPGLVTTIFQIHQKDGPVGIIHGLPSGPNIMEIKIDGGVNGGNINANIHKTYGEFNNVKETDLTIRLLSLKEARGKWVDYMINFDTSNGNQNLSYYVNGKFIGETGKFTKFVPSKYVFKYGIYNYFMKTKRGPDFQLPIRIIYHDEIRIGNSREAVEITDDGKPVD